MYGRLNYAFVVVLFGLALVSTSSFSEEDTLHGDQKPPNSFIKVFPPYPGGLRYVEHGGNVTVKPINGATARVAMSCKDDIARLCSETRDHPSSCLMQQKDALSHECRSTLQAFEADDMSYTGGVPPCSHAPICGNQFANESEVPRVEWRQTMGYRVAYPIYLPQDGLTDIADGGAVSLAIDSKGNIWVLQRSAIGTPQLSKFDSHYKLIRRVGDDIIGHQIKAHGIAIDPQDNVWVCDAAGATIKVVSPEGKLVKTFGIGGRRGDWDEAKGQRLLWQPLSVAFSPSGDAYIGESHANESPNDVGLSPTNNCGCARVIHLDKNGRFINQWYGNSWGPGKFTMVHAIAVDPKTGNVWLGDREQYRLVVYSRDGKFIKTVQLRNLVCAVGFDAEDNLWVATGHDGQVIKLDYDGHVLGAVGDGRGIGPGQFGEASFMAWDKEGNMFVSDTSTGRVTEFVKPE